MPSIHTFLKTFLEDVKIIIPYFEICEAVLKIQLFKPIFESEILIDNNNYFLKFNQHQSHEKNYFFLALFLC